MKMKILSPYLHSLLALHFGTKIPGLLHILKEMVAPFPLEKDYAWEKKLRLAVSCATYGAVFALLFLNKHLRFDIPTILTAATALSQIATLQEEHSVGAQIFWMGSLVGYLLEANLIFKENPEYYPLLFARALTHLIALLAFTNPKGFTATLQKVSKVIDFPLANHIHAVKSYALLSFLGSSEWVAKAAYVTEALRIAHSLSAVKTDRIK